LTFLFSYCYYIYYQETRGATILGGPVAAGTGNGKDRGMGGNISERQKAIGRRNIMCSTLQFGVASPGTTRNGKGDLRRRTSLTR
jgi:hypothetical protein